MKEIYIISERGNSTAYGIGTYLREYVCCLKSLEFKINLIELDSVQNEFQITEDDHVRKFIFPRSYSGQADSYYIMVARLLFQYAGDRENLIFNIQHFHLVTLADEIRKYFPGAKIILTIHYLAWIWRLNGDTNLFRDIISAKASKKIHEKYKGVLESHHEHQSIFSKSDALVCLSENTYDLISEHYPMREDKLHLITNGLRDTGRRLSLSEKSKIRKKFHFGTDEKILLFVGRLDKLKGIYDVLSCFHNILKLYPDCRLVIAGAAGDFIRTIDAGKNIWSKITFIGQVSPKELAQIYRIANIGLLPSHSEECSYVAIEMMMYGLPVVCSDGRGLNMMFKDGDNARVAAIGNPKKEDIFRTNLTNAILDLLSSDELRMTISRQARKCFETKYDISHMQRLYRELFEKWQ